MQSSHNVNVPSSLSLALQNYENKIKSRNIHEPITANKWNVLKDIREAKDEIGINDRAIAVLNGLLSFLPDVLLSATINLVVFPSNKTLCDRTHGMSEPTLRRHLSALIQANLIFRKDSANRKRYSRKGEGGVIKEAYGFDLSPLLSRAQEFAMLALKARTEAQEEKSLRDKIHLHRRNIKETIDLFSSEQMSQEFLALLEEFELYSLPLKRVVKRDELERQERALFALNVKIENSLNLLLNAEVLSGNAAQNERHKESQKHNNTDFKLTFENTNDPKRKRDIHSNTNVEATVKLSSVLRACPKIKDISQGEINSFEDLVETGRYLQSIFNISNNLIWEAYKIYSHEAVAIILAIIYERRSEIQNPGAYFRSLMRKSLLNDFSISKNIASLLKKSNYREAQKSNPGPNLRSAEEINKYYENIGSSLRVGSFYEELYAEFTQKKSNCIH